MKEPVYLLKSHAGLKVYSGGQNIGLIPHDQVAHLLVTAAEQLSRRPAEYDPITEFPPTGLADLLSKAIAEETATHAPRTTLAIKAMQQALAQLEGR